MKERQRSSSIVLSPSTVGACLAGNSFRPRLGNSVGVLAGGVTLLRHGFPNCLAVLQSLVSGLPPQSSNRVHCRFCCESLGLLLRSLLFWVACAHGRPSIRLGGNA